MNTIELKWAHDKKAIAQPERLSASREEDARVCEYDRCDHRGHLKQVVVQRNEPSARKKFA
jgi:hypothetical protein